MFDYLGLFFNILLVYLGNNILIDVEIAGKVRVFYFEISCAVGI